MIGLIEHEEKNANIQKINQNDNSTKTTITTNIPELNKINQQSDDNDDDDDDDMFFGCCAMYKSLLNSILNCQIYKDAEKQSIYWKLNQFDIRPKYR